MTRRSTLSPDTLAYLSDTHSLPALAVITVECVACVSKWAMRRRTRRALRQLTVWQLEDVGLTPLAAHSEASKAFWRM